MSMIDRMMGIYPERMSDEEKEKMMNRWMEVPELRGFMPQAKMKMMPGCPANPPGSP